MHDLFPKMVFYGFAGVTILAALLVVTQNNPVRCVLFLVLAFLTSSVLWVLVHAEFLALILVLVYVGAVMTLFLFVVMMLNIDAEESHSHMVRYLPFGLILVALLIGLLLAAIPKGAFQTDVKVSVAAESLASQDYMLDEEITTEKPRSNTEALGLVLYTDYVFAFESAAVILLVAIVAAITLVHRNPMRSKRQIVVRQIMTRPEDRVQLHRMKSEKP